MATSVAQDIALAMTKLGMQQQTVVVEDLGISNTFLPCGNHLDLRKFRRSGMPLLYGVRYMQHADNEER